MVALPQFVPKGDWSGWDNTWRLRIMGRLAPEADEVQLQTSLELLLRNVLSRTEAGAIVERPAILLQEGRHGVMRARREMAEPLWFLQGVVGLVLLIACTNLAGLLLARGAGRQHEMAVRAAMGAGRWRLIRQSLTESMVLSLAGVCLGLVISLWIRGALTGFVIDPSGNQQFNLQIDANVLVFALAVGVITTLLSGLLPALYAGSTSPSAGLKDGRPCGAPRLRFGKVLVTAQVGMSVLLVAVAGLLCRTLINLYQTDLGFDTENILLVNIQPPESLSEVENLRQFHPTMRQKIAAIPGVKSVAVSNWTLLRGAMRNPDISIPGRPEAEQREAEELVISDKYFATMGISLLAGRDFDGRDTRDSERVVIVNAEFGRLFFPDESPLGQFITAWDEQYRIVGLCGDHIYGGLRRGIRPILYMPHSQKWEPHLTYAIRSVLPPLSLAPAVRRVVAEVDRNLPLEGITTQKLAIKESLVQERLFASLCGGFAVLAVLLSCIGLYGIMAYNVARRTGEMGIRKALGAQPLDVAWPILRGALMLTIVGVAIGLPIALALARWMRSVFFGIGPHDPLTMIGTVAIMATVAALAAWIPARRAARVDPMTALRYE
jgi:predicted permease